MELDIIAYPEVVARNAKALQQLELALCNKGIVGINLIPQFEEKSRAFINAARQFAALNDAVKQQYAPHRDSGDTEGYELGAEWFQDQHGTWKVDDKKASFYAVVPEHIRNKWPQEMDFKTPYLALGELIFTTGKLLLDAIGVNAIIGREDALQGYGRMLHYHKEGSATDCNPDWCGAHFDHGVFTGLIPAYYFRDGVEIEEPHDAGLFIMPHHANTFEKIQADDKATLLFQVGEFGQLLAHDRIRATQHKVKKAKGDIERYTFALFYGLEDSFMVTSHSTLTNDTRYAQNKLANGSVSFGDWSTASFARYRAVPA